MLLSTVVSERASKGEPSQLTVHTNEEWVAARLRLVVVEIGIIEKPMLVD